MKQQGAHDGSLILYHSLPISEHREERGGGFALEVLAGVAFQKFVDEAVMVELVRDMAEHGQHGFLVRAALRGGEDKGELGDAEAQGKEPEIREEAPGAGEGIEAQEAFVDGEIFEDMAETRMELESISERLESLANAIHSWNAQLGENYVYWLDVTPVGRGGRIRPFGAD